VDALDKIRKIREQLKLQKLEYKFKVTVNIGTSSICVGANDVFRAFQEIIKERNIEDVIITRTGESGISSLEPIVKVIEKGTQAVIYYNMDPEKVEKVISEHILKGKIVTAFLK